MHFVTVGNDLAFPDERYGPVLEEIVDAVLGVCRMHGVAVWGGSLVEYGPTPPAHGAQACINPACGAVFRPRSAHQQYHDVRCRQRAAYDRWKRRHPGGPR